MLRTQKLQIGYTAQKPLLSERLDLEIPEGKFVSLLGANGTGKSTLLHTLAGLLPPLSGDILWKNTALRKSATSTRAKNIAMVLSPRPIAPTLRVHEVIELGRYPHQAWQGLRGNLSGQKAVEKALALTELEALAKRKLYTLSDGEHQKVMIARALAQDTPLILLDEPTAHLDLPNRIMIFQMLRQLCQNQKKTILTSTHELNLALQVSDEVWLLKRAGKMSIGTPEDMILQDKFTETFPEKGFSFDKHTGNFQIHHRHQSPIQLKGQGAARHWTKQALEKNGFSTSLTSGSLCVEINEKTNAGISWEVTQNQCKSSTVFSIYELINYLKNA